MSGADNNTSEEGHEEKQPELWLQEPFVIFTQPTTAELNNALWLVYREEVAGKAILTTFCMVFGISTIITIIVLIENFHELINAVGMPGNIFIIDSAILSGPLAILTCIIVWQLLKRQALRAFDGRPHLQHFMFYTFASNGLQIQFPNVTAMLDWAKVSTCIETPESLCLMVQGRLYTLPKRCFWSREQLKYVRRIIIDQGVRYSTIGTNNPQQPYALNCSTLTIEVGESVIAELLEDHKNGMLSSDFGDNLATQNILQLNEPHPQSSMITEPFYLPNDLDALKLQCSYKLQELKNINRLYFYKFTLPYLGWLYLIWLGIVSIAPAILCHLLEFEQGVEFFSTELLILLPGLVLYTWHIVDKRTDILIEFLKTETPIFLELSENACHLKSRRSYCIYAWSQFLECISTKDHYLCRLPVGSVIIPKKILDTSIKRAYVENLLRTKIKKYEEWS